LGVPIEEHPPDRSDRHLQISPSDQLRRYSRSYSTRVRILSIVSVSQRCPFSGPNAWNRVWPCVSPC